jgi:hypothetical protein
MNIAKPSEQPCAYLWKDVIRVGRYRHPARRFVVHVNRRRLDHWSRTFRRMSRNGVRVPIPADHSPAAADNRGYVIEMKRVADRLMALCHFIGADAVRDAGRNEVSIGVAPTFVDGKGLIYRDAIVHVALTPVPVVPEQGPFIAAENFSADSKAQRCVFAAMPGAAPAGVLTFSAAQLIGRADMAQNMLPCSDQTLSALHDLVPGLIEVPDEQKLEQVLQYIQSLAADADQAEPPQTLSRAAPEMDPVLEQALLESIKSKRDLCVSRGALTPAVADVLLSRLLPATPSDGVLTLSRGQTDGGATLALSIFTALADNRPLALGEQTRRQASALPRTVPGESQPSGPPLYEKMAAMADGKCVQL